MLAVVCEVAVLVCWALAALVTQKAVMHRASLSVFMIVSKSFVKRYNVILGLKPYQATRDFFLSAAVLAYTRWHYAICVCKNFLAVS